MKKSSIVIVALCISFASSVLSNGNESFENAMYRLRLANTEKNRNEIKETIQQYSRISSGIYSTGEISEGIEKIPATPLLKRRLAKDVNMLGADGLVMVFDRDRMDIGNIEFKNRQFASAETREVWAIALQELQTRKMVYNVKAVKLNVRYLLYRGPLFEQGGRWLVYDIDIYPQQ